MLGSGRPFVFEFINPKKAISCHDSVKDITVDTPYVRCHDFKIVDKAFFDRLKEIENSKAKRYAAVVRVGVKGQREINDQDCITLN